MQITLNMSNEQIQLLAEKLGYKSQVEDTSQELDGDSYPLIDNPVTLQQFAEGLVNNTLTDMVLDRLRSEASDFLTNEYNKLTENIARGDYDADIMSLPADQLLATILSDIGS